jgi:hypothetical protein
MFIGHFALGFAAKRAAPRLSVAVLFAAAQFADIIWPVLVALGFEQVRIDPGNTAFTPLDFISYPYSHSLLFLCLWGVLFGFAAAVIVRNATAGIVVGALVVSHWVLDWITHRPDMPLYPGSATFGLGLWNSVAGTVALESLMFVVGLRLYLRSTRARDVVGRRACAAFVGFVVAAYAGSSLGPPPPSVTALIGSAMAGGAIIIAWAWWFDHHRNPTA